MKLASLVLLVAVVTTGFGAVHSYEAAVDQSPVVTGITASASAGLTVSRLSI